MSVDKLQIASDLYVLANDMREIAERMKAYWPDRAEDIKGAAEIADGWWKGIREEVREKLGGAE